MSRLFQLLRQHYPDAPPRAWRLIDDGSGGIAIGFWDEAALGPQPTEAEIAAWGGPRRKVAKDLVEQRLAAVGKLDACMAIIMGNAAFFSRWYARAFPFVYADDPDTIAVLDQVGADPVSILAA